MQIHSISDNFDDAVVGKFLITVQFMILDSLVLKELFVCLFLVAQFDQIEEEKKSCLFL